MAVVAGIQAANLAQVEKQLGHKSRNNGNVAERHEALAHQKKSTDHVTAFSRLFFFTQPDVT